MGEAILQKSFCTDFLTKKYKKNEGELPQYHVRNSHPAIISPEVYELAQLETQRRKMFGKHYTGQSVFSCRIVCGDCGGFFGSKVWHSTDPYRKVVWQCNRKYERSTSKGKGQQTTPDGRAGASHHCTTPDRQTGNRHHCNSPHISENDVKAAFVEVIQRLIADKPAVLETCQAVLNEILHTDDLDTQIVRLQAQTVEIEQQIRSLISDNARKGVEPDPFKAEYDKLVGRYEKLIGKITEIQREKDDRALRAKKIDLFMQMLIRQDECLEFDPALFIGVVEKVVVSGTKKNVQMRFVLGDGEEHHLPGVVTCFLPTYTSSISEGQLP